MRTFTASLALVVCSLPFTAQATLTELFGSVPFGFGRRSDVVGDWNNDGQDDFLISSPLEPNGFQPLAGAVRVYSGANGSILLQVRGQGGHRLGQDAAPAGDLNGDGHIDLVCGSPSFDRIDPLTQLTLIDCGRVLAFSGADGSVLLEVVGRAAYDFVGTAVSGAGDLDGDGLDDLVFGAPGAEWNGAPTNSGVVQAHSVPNGVLWTSLGLAAGGNLGSDVSATDDLDGDGRPEVIAAPVRLLDGASGSTLSFLFNGTRVAGGVDFDLDGAGDFVVGWREFGNNAGRVQVVSGATSAILFELTGQGDQGFGAAVAVSPDVDADGIPDFVLGAPGWDTPLASNAGAVCVHSGRDGSLIRFFPGTNPGQALGTAVGAGGDINGDGWADVIASGVGVVYTFSVLPSGVTPLGQSSADCVGPARLMVSGVPSVGNQDLRLHATGLPPSAPALIVLGTSPAVPGTQLLGLELYVDVGLTGFSAFSSPPTSATGVMITPVPIPNDSSLQGNTYWTQVFGWWPQAPCGPRWSSTSGLRLDIP